jgi:hypothetical protein
MNTYKVTATDAKEKFALWIKERGGVAVWKDHNLSRFGGDTFTPADHTQAPKWGYVREDTVTDISAFKFPASLKEVKRFRVATRLGDQGFAIKLTDASSTRLNKELDKAGPDAGYHFDYDTQEAVITVPEWE